LPRGPSNRGPGWVAHIEAPGNTRESTGAGPGPWLLLCAATGAGAGFAPIAPGTAGAAVGVALFWLLVGLGPWLYALALLALLSLGIRAADAAERAYGRKDDGRIVIDEVVGQLLALAPLSAAGEAAGWFPVVTGFVAFRVFDVWKPPLARRAERLGGGAGVMLDDVVAGACAAPFALAALATGWLAG